MSNSAVPRSGLGATQKPPFRVVLTQDYTITQRNNDFGSYSNNDTCLS